MPSSTLGGHQYRSDLQRCRPFLFLARPLKCNQFVTVFPQRPAIAWGTGPRTKGQNHPSHSEFTPNHALTYDIKTLSVCGTKSTAVQHEQVSIKSQIETLPNHLEEARLWFRDDFSYTFMPGV